jgi:hypothetical protein
VSHGSEGARPSHGADVRDGYLPNHRANRRHSAAVAMAENMQFIESQPGINGS